MRVQSRDRIDVANLVVPGVTEHIEPARSKPRFRGMLDVAAVIAFVPAVAVLMVQARSGLAAVGALVYGVALILLFAVSASYHIPMWSRRVRAIWRSADHSMIYVLIAGSYTPVCLTSLPPDDGTTLLAVAWGIAALGMLKSTLWPRSPRALNTAVYLFMGWLAVPYVPELWAGLGVTGVALIGVGGLLYSFGALVYAKRWFNVWPDTFGYHEFFHLFVVAAAVLHFACFWRLLT